MELDLEERKKGFLEAYGKIREEFELDIFFQPVWIPDGKGSFVTAITQNLVDINSLSVPSNPDNFL